MGTGYVLSDPAHRHAEERHLEAELRTKLLSVGPREEASVEHGQWPFEVAGLTSEKVQQLLVVERGFVEPALLERHGLVVEDRGRWLSGEELRQLALAEGLLEEISLGELDTGLRERRSRRSAGPSATPPVECNIVSHG
jgi:hypothetical protein